MRGSERYGTAWSAMERNYLWNPHALFALGTARERHHPERAAGMESASSGKGVNVKGNFGR
jgi:hypothetical protein